MQPNTITSIEQQQRTVMLLLLNKVWGDEPTNTPRNQYKLGWYMRAEDWAITWCCTDDERAGWLASDEADEALVKVGVR